MDAVHKHCKCQLVYEIVYPLVGILCLGIQILLIPFNYECSVQQHLESCSVCSREGVMITDPLNGNPLVYLALLWAADWSEQ